MDEQGQPDGITEILQNWSEEKDGENAEALFNLVYDELR
jgi:hypothetical protein